MCPVEHILGSIMANTEQYFTNPTKLSYEVQSIGLEVQAGLKSSYK